MQYTFRVALVLLLAFCAALCHRLLSVQQLLQHLLHAQPSDGSALQVWMAPRHEVALPMQ
jgi:hypothetical protein